MENYSYTRYLASKKTVDDRALNKDVVAVLRQQLAARQELQILEIGAGLGTMVARLVEWDFLVRAQYLLVDVDLQLLSDSRQWLTDWSVKRGLKVEDSAGGLHISASQLDLKVHFKHCELGDFLNQPEPVQVDLLIANAFLDLVEVPVMLPRLFRCLAPDGLYWFSINFDGETIFQPEDSADQNFMEVYHLSMDERVRYGRPAGESRTGRHLFHHLHRAGAAVLAAGASDWLVYPGGQAYPADEAYFLKHILRTIEEELQTHPEIDSAELQRWLAVRRAQIDRGDLLYVAHQLDFAGNLLLHRPELIVK